MARYYVLSVEPTLFGDSALVREWGRIGVAGRRRLDLFQSAQIAKASLEQWLARKLRRGYRPVRIDRVRRAARCVAPAQTPSDP